MLLQRSPFTCPLQRADRRAKQLQIISAVAPRTSFENSVRDERVLSGSRAGTPGPAGAFVEGQEAEARQQLFGKIAPVYDQLNNLLSLGQHRIWKRMAVKWSGAHAGHAAVDLCCGSGDLAFILAEAVGPSGQVTGLDFAAEMLQDADNRQMSLPSSSKRRQSRIRWIQGDAQQLPFQDNSFDAATMGYGLRNVANIPKALRELQRVLKPGAKVAVLDFNNSTNPAVDAIQGWALENVVVPMARSYGLCEEYEYLRPSIKRFPTGSEQVRLAKEAGFTKAVHYEIGFNLMGVLVATK
ncbi:2-phytyl-1,4-naphtoquinone methyltransferase [Coccomyxa sp. Obi]|nr:2-phytyl-1,4-naphtoquinone methyltransferase [Coccomyxa sp. Obi]